MAAVMARTRDPASEVRETNATPQIPHTLFFDLRCGKEGLARAHDVLPQMETRNTQPAVGVPSENNAEKHEEEGSNQRQKEIKKRFALEEQAPVDGFIPSRIDGVQKRPEMKSFQGNARDAHV